MQNGVSSHHRAVPLDAGPQHLVHRLFPPGAGKDRLLAFHVCDWLVPTKDILNDRGMMGDGVIDIKSVRAAVEAQGFTGYSEIEIFSGTWWEKPMDEVLRTCIERHRSAV